jgi:hypothetical protein
MRKTTIFYLGVLLALSFILSGCYNGNLPEPQRMYYLQNNWGHSQETAKYRQTLNPEAGLTAEPVEGLDGQSADLAVDKYRETFRKEVDVRDLVSPTFVIEQD